MTNVLFVTLQDRVYEEKCIGENAATNLISAPVHTPMPSPCAPPAIPPKMGRPCVGGGGVMGMNPRS